jgi:hypothetical protein
VSSLTSKGSSRFPCTLWRAFLGIAVSFAAMLVAVSGRAQAGSAGPVDCGAAEDAALPSCSDLKACELQLSQKGSLRLAHCLEAEGACGAARAKYERAAAPDSAAISTDVELARRRLQTIDQDCPAPALLTITTAGNPDNLEVRLDDQVMVLDAGVVTVRAKQQAHTIRASAAGHRPWSVTVAPKAGSHVSIAVPSLEAVPPEPVEPPLPVDEPEPRPPSEDNGPNPWLTGVTVVAGVVTVGSTAWFLSAQRGANEAYTDHVNATTVARRDDTWGNVEDAREHRDLAGTVLTGSTIVLGVSALALVTEWTLLRGQEPEGSVTARVALQPGHAALNIGGAF